MLLFLLIIFYFGLPIFVIWLTTKYKFFEKIGAIVIIYIIGLLVGNLGLIPSVNTKSINFVRDFSVALAIPLILFSINIKLWFRLVGRTLISVLLGLISVIIIIIAGFFIFRDKIPEIAKISGMLVGLYSGGDPNLASIKTALNVSENTYIIILSSDLFIGTIFLLFILTYGKKFFKMFLPKYDYSKQNKILSESLKDTDFKPFKEYFNNKAYWGIILGTLLSLFVVGISSLFEKYGASMVILLITTLSVLLSFIPKVRNLKFTFQTGMYFIIVFSLIISSQADFRQIMQIKSLYILLYVTMSVLGAVIIHSLLAKIFKIDADMMIISSIALIYSVPFVPVVASALKNKYIILSGIVVGLFGYVIGNYLGILLPYILQRF